MMPAWRHVANRQMAFMSAIRKKQQYEFGNNNLSSNSESDNQRNIYSNYSPGANPPLNSPQSKEPFNSNTMWSNDNSNSVASTTTAQQNEISQSMGNISAMSSFPLNSISAGIQSPLQLGHALFLQRALQKQLQMGQYIQKQQEAQQYQLQQLQKLQNEELRLQQQNRMKQVQVSQIEDIQNIEADKKNYQLYQAIQSQMYQQQQQQTGSLEDLNSHESYSVMDMESFLMQELEPSPPEDYCFFDQSALEREAMFQLVRNCDASFQYSPSSIDDGMRASEVLAHAQEALIQSAVRDPDRFLTHLHKLSFQDLYHASEAHLLNFGPLPDMTLFQLFRKVDTCDQAKMAVAILSNDRNARLIRGIASPYSEVTSSSIFGALNRTGSDDFVVQAAEKALPLGLTLSRSNIYHLMKQYSVQGKVEYVERLFRALEASGKTWNSNCIVIMMLAYFNQGMFEEADGLRKELKSKGIKISERIEDRLDKLLIGKEKWRWEDKVYSRAERNPLKPPPGFSNILNGNFFPGLNVQAAAAAAALFCQQPYYNNQQIRLYNAQTFTTASTSLPTTVGKVESYTFESVPTLSDALQEPRLHLNILRAAGFDELLEVLSENLKTRGPVENVCISFLFRKVENRNEVEKAMEFLKKERAARKTAGISEEYNETTCSRIFTALFRAGAPDLALDYAASAKEAGLILSGKALHELLKSFAIRNEVDKVEDIWKLVKTHGKPSSRIVYSIFRTYFDNNLMSHARAFRDEVLELGLNLSASATKNIEEVLSGAKQWVKDPQALTREN